MLNDCGICRDDTVLVGLSGGADSTALLLMLYSLLQEDVFSGLCAAHLHHGIRGADADTDVRFCQVLCARLGIPLTVDYVDVPTAAKTTGETLEQAARTLRYTFLRRVKAETNADCIAVAHHRDDQAETVLMHLLRGCGLSGLTGMQLRSGDIVRPFLTVSRGEIETYLSQCGQGYRTDATNAENRQTRNRIRNELLPLMKTFNPTVADALCKTARLADADERYLNTIAEAAAQTLFAEDGYDRRGLVALPEPIRARVVKKRLLSLSADVTQADICRVCDLAGAQTGTCIELRQGKHAWVDDKRLYIGTYPEQTAYETPFVLNGETAFPGGRFLSEQAQRWWTPQDGNEAFLDVDCLPEHAVVRTRRNGDRFQPLGTPGMRKLSDVMTDRKIPRQKRDIPLLASGSTVYYAAGLAICQQARITDGTKRILHIVYCRG